MTKEQINEVWRLKREGKGATRIAATLGLPVNTVKSFLRRHKEDEPQEELHRCKQCGKTVLQTPGRKEKIFCSDRCRMLWWNSHQELVKRKAIYSFTCLSCGREFTAYGNAHRKYCCHDCYINDRFGGKHE